ncbi:MAG: hypothetical protein DYH20_05565 [Gammaproteobacteria bacterium PRO9]|nr:hypothetical protein [Gammaproteobacteria bacterium PRO9]
MSIFRALVMDEQYPPIAVANGFLSASLAIFAGISSTDEVRRMLHRLGDELLGGDNEPPQTNH